MFPECFTYIYECFTARGTHSHTYPKILNWYSIILKLRLKILKTNIRPLLGPTSHRHVWERSTPPCHVVSVSGVKRCRGSWMCVVVCRIVTSAGSFFSSRRALAGRLQQMTSPNVWRRKHFRAVHPHRQLLACLTDQLSFHYTSQTKLKWSNFNLNVI